MVLVRLRRKGADSEIWRRNCISICRLSFALLLFLTLHSPIGVAQFKKAASRPERPSVIVDLSARPDIRSLLKAHIRPTRKFYLILEMSGGVLFNGQIVVIRAEGSDVCTPRDECLTLFFYKAEDDRTWKTLGIVLPAEVLLVQEEFYFDGERYGWLMFGPDGRNLVFYRLQTSSRRRMMHLYLSSGLKTRG